MSVSYAGIRNIGLIVAPLTVSAAARLSKRRKEKRSAFRRRGYDVRRLGQAGAAMRHGRGIDGIWRKALRFSALPHF